MFYTLRKIWWQLNCQWSWCNILTALLLGQNFDESLPHCIQYRFYHYYSICSNSSSSLHVIYGLLNRCALASNLFLFRLSNPSADIPHKCLCCVAAQKVSSNIHGGPKSLLAHSLNYLTIPIIRDCLYNHFP